MGGAPAPAPAAPSTQSQGRERLIAQLLAPKETHSRPAVSEPVPEPTAADAEPAEAAEASDGAEDTGTAPEPEPAATEPEEPVKPQKPENARLAKALVDLEREQASRMRMEARLKAMEAQFESAKADELAALKAFGHDPEKLIAKMLDGQIKKPDEPKLTEEQKALKELQERLAKVEEERNEVLAKETYRKELDAISEKVKERPVVSVYPWAAERIHAAFYQEYEQTGQTPDLDEVIEKVESHIAGDLRLAFSSERALKTLVESDPKLREMVVKALGLQPSKPTTEKRPPARQESTRAQTQSEGPTAITPAMASEVAERSASEKLTPQQRREKAIARLLAPKPNR